MLEHRIRATDEDLLRDHTPQQRAPRPQVWSQTRWSVIVPFFNERAHLPACIASLAGQHEPFDLILVDNASTDGSAEVALEACARAGLAATLLVERTAGKVAALRRGQGAVQTEFVATCDADTIYPADYLTRGAALLDGGAAAAVAATAAPGASALRRAIAGWKLQIAAALLPQQCLNGGAGQVFRTAALLAVGGFDPQIWNWVLEDHEIMARIEHQGPIAYHREFQCAPTPRPATASTVGWTLQEQLIYHFSRAEERYGFFHGYLDGALRERALTSDKLRRHDGQLSPT